MGGIPDIGYIFLMHQCQPFINYIAPDRACRDSDILCANRLLSGIVQQNWIDRSTGTAIGEYDCGAVWRKMLITPVKQGCNHWEEIIAALRQ